MQLSIQSDDGTVLRMGLKGRVTQKELPTDKDLFAAEIGASIYSRRVLLDMQESEFLDSSGVSWLLSAHKRFEEQGGKLAMHSMQPVVSNVLKVLRMDQILAIAENDKAALKLVKGDLA